MRLHLAITVTLCLLIGSGLRGQTRSPEAQLKAAQNAEHVEGNLKGAIEQYKQLISRRDISRSVAAEARLGLAQSYEKLGAADARAVYEQIVRDYADQTVVAAAARERVSALAMSQSRGLVARQLLQLPNNFEVVFLMSDGRIGATDWNTGDLVLVSSPSGEITRVVQGDYSQAPGASAYRPLMSPDRRQLAYHWSDANEPGVLRVLPMERGAKPRTVAGDPKTMSNIAPMAWSKDSASILVSYKKPVEAGNLELAWIPLGGGAARPVKTFEAWRSGAESPNVVDGVELSPDGAWLTFTMLDRQGAHERSIFVMRTDGSGERRVVSGGVNDQPIWTPDGRIVFVSTRSGELGLWLAAVNEGRDNTPTLIKNGLGRVSLKGMLPSGELVYEETGLDPLVVAEFDPPLASSKTPVSLRTVETLNGIVPEWSTDGRFLAYKRHTTNPARPVELVIRTSETSQLRTYTPRTGNMGTARPAWHIDGTVQAVGQSGIRVKVLGSSLEEIQTPRLPFGSISPDGRTWYTGGVGTDTGFGGFDVSSGARTSRITIPNNWRPAGLSPDGKTFVLVSDQVGPGQTLAVIGVDGSGFRQLPARLAGRINGESPRLTRPIWTSDGSALIVSVDTGNDTSALQRVPVAGGQPITLVANIAALRTFDISPDNRQIAISFDRPAFDIWALDLKAVLK